MKHLESSLSEVLPNKNNLLSVRILHLFIREISALGYAAYMSDSES